MTIAKIVYIVVKVWKRKGTNKKTVFGIWGAIVSKVLNSFVFLNSFPPPINVVCANRFLL